MKVVAAGGPIAGVQGHYSFAFLHVVIRTEDAPENSYPRIM